MALLKILQENIPEENAALRRISRPVEEITPRILTLLDDMAQTMRTAQGVGLAAPQVGVLRRIVVIETTPGKLVELINPKIIEASEETQNEREGCLSTKGRFGYTVRPHRVVVEAIARDGHRFRVTGEGLTARALCHEVDHLDGRLFIDIVDKVFTDPAK